MFGVVEIPAFGAIGTGSFIDVDGDKHEAIWSLSDGSLLKDFGADSQISDARSILGETFVAYNDPTGAYVLNFDTNQVFDLKTLTGSQGLSNSPRAVCLRRRAAASQRLAFRIRRRWGFRPS